ncbi:MAG: branched-chain amino acid ABC transporter permease, partial [Chthonomonadales bacterium]
MRWLSTRYLQVGLTFAALLTISAITGRLQDYYMNVLILCGIYVILAVSLNLINGITGQFSIGHAGFYAVGAYTGAAWTKIILPRIVDTPLLQIGTLQGDIINLLIALVLGSTAAAITGLLVGLPSLRLRGDYLAIVTLGFGEVIRVIFLNMDVVGGARGLSGIPSIVSNHNLAFFWVFLFVVIAIVISRNLVKSVRGLTFLAVREDEIAADAMGVNTTKVKVTAFVIGSALAGAAGVLYAH